MVERTWVSAVAASAIVSGIVCGCGSSGGGAATTPLKPYNEAGAMGNDSAASGSNTMTMTPDDAGASQSSDAEAGGSLVCFPPSDGDECDVCTAANCCVEFAACAGTALDATDESECQTIQDCMDACASGEAGVAGDAGVDGAPPAAPNCTAMCLTPHGNDQAVIDYNKLTTCQQAKCAGTC
jgi:hypothetical protein